MTSRLPASSAAMARRLIRRPQATSPFATYSLSYYDQPPAARRLLSVHSFVPRVFSPSWWSQQLPKGLLRSKPNPNPSSVTVAKPRRWNPAWGFVLLALFVGSQSLNIIAFRQETAVFVRRADARIDTLKEIIGRIQSGEWAADGPEVQQALRLGQQSRDDRSWEEAMHEIEQEDSKWQQEVQRQRKLIEKQEAERAKFASLASPTAWAEDEAKKEKDRKQVTAEDYYM